MNRDPKFSMSIPLVDMGAQQEEIADEVETGMKEVFGQISFIGGPAVTEFGQAHVRSSVLIEPERVWEAVSARTQAIMPVHLYGQTAFVELLEHIGAAASTSCYPGKNLGAPWTLEQC
jgi:hypothetical protein